MVQVISVKKVKKARTQHRCNYCGGVIDKGEPYESSRYKYDGEFYEWKEHEYCSAVARELYHSGYFQDDGNGMTEADFSECVRELHDTFVASLFPCSVQAMSKDLADLFETHKLEAYRPNGYTVNYSMVPKKAGGAE